MIAPNALIRTGFVFLAIADGMAISALVKYPSAESLIVAMFPFSLTAGFLLIYGIGWIAIWHSNRSAGKRNDDIQGRDA